MYLLYTAHCPLLTVLDDPAAADNLISAVKHGRLTGCDGALWFVKSNLDPVVRERCDRRRRGSVTITNADRRTDFIVWSIQRQPIYTCRLKLLAGKFIIVAHHNTIPRCVDGNNIQRLAARDADA